MSDGTPEGEVYREPALTRLMVAGVSTLLGAAGWTLAPEPVALTTKVSSSAMLVWAAYLYLTALGVPTATEVIRSG